MSLDQWEMQRAAMYDAWVRNQERICNFTAQRRHLGGDAWELKATTHDGKLIHSVTGKGLDSCLISLLAGLTARYPEHHVVNESSITKITPRTVIVAIFEKNDGELHTSYFITQELADAFLNSVVSDYKTTFPVETFIDSLTHIEAKNNSKAFESTRD